MFIIKPSWIRDVLPNIKHTIAPWRRVAQLPSYNNAKIFNIIYSNVLTLKHEFLIPNDTMEVYRHAINSFAGDSLILASTVFSFSFMNTVHVELRTSM